MPTTCDLVLANAHIVTMDEHLEPANDKLEMAAKASSSQDAWDLYASRYWALRTLWESDYDAESPIADPDLKMIDPSRYGYKSAKLMTSIEFVSEGKGSMACDIGPYYSPGGEILPGYDTPLDLGGKTKRKIKGGEITDF